MNKSGQCTDSQQGKSPNIALGKTSPSPTHGQASKIPNINTDQNNALGTPAPTRRSN